MQAVANVAVKWKRIRKLTNDVRAVQTLKRPCPILKMRHRKWMLIPGLVSDYFPRVKPERLSACSAGRDSTIEWGADVHVPPATSRARERSAA